jgi:hypothetical protein
MAFSPLQAGFPAGEIGPRFHGLVGSDLYKAALAECLNFEVLPGGAIRKRGPTRYVAALLSGGSRLIPFKTVAGRDYILELGNLVARIYTTTGRIGAGGGTGVNLVPANAFAGVRLAVTRTFDPDLKIWEYDYGQAATVVNVVTAGDYAVVWSKTGPGSLAVLFTWAGGSAYLASPGLVSLPAGAVTLTVGVNGSAGDYVENITVSATSVGSGASFEIVTPWTTAQLPAVQFVSETGRDRMILVHPEVAPFQITRAANGTWSSGAFVFTWKPAEWTDGPPLNWPSTVEIHAGRLWLGGTPGQQNRLWASRVGALEDFRRFTVVATGLPTDVKDANSQVTPECGLDVVVSTKSSIRWLRAQRNLLLGTDQSEHYVVGSGGSPPAAGDVDAILGSEFSSAALQAVAAGDQVLYVSADRRKPRVIGWELQAESWVSRDLAWYAPHLTKKGIDEAYFAKAPVPSGIFKLADGTIAACCYDRAAQQLAWWRFEVGGGQVLSGCVTDGAYGSIVWLSILRGATACLEFYRLDDDGEALVDGLVSVVLGANLTITGLGHLEGKAVQVVVAGTVVDAVVAGGQVVLAEDQAVAGDVAEVGVGYLARAKTLPLEGGNPRGTAQASNRRWANVRLRLNDSALPKVNGYRAADRSPGAAMNRGQPRVTGDVDVQQLGDEDAAGQLTIEQELPLRTEVLAIFGSAQVNQV